MYILPHSAKKIRERAMRYRRSLINEEKNHGYISDGAGKRYLVGPLFVLADDLGKAIDYYKWYEEEFSDDSGEPLHYIYWALALFRVGNIKEAEKKLLEALVQNIYILFALTGMKIGKHDIWYGSNFEDPDYLFEIPEDMLPTLSEEERLWTQKMIESITFQRVLKEYIATFHALKYEKEVIKRTVILDNWYGFLEKALRQSANISFEGDG